MATSARSNSRSRTRLERVALAWRRFGSFSAAGRALGPVAPFGFSWLAALSLRRPPLMSLGFSWISLDSLVRIETYQWVTRHKAEKLFSRASCLAFERRWDGARGLGMWKGRIAHGASLTEVRISRKKLSFESVALGRLNPKAGSFYARRKCCSPPEGASPTTIPRSLKSSRWARVESPAARVKDGFRPT